MSVGLGVSIGAMSAAFHLTLRVVGIDFDVDLRQSLDVDRLGIVVGGFGLFATTTARTPRVARPEAAQMEIGDVVALGV
jgi:hypothetical protein